MSFGFSAPSPYLLDDIEICFLLNSVFQLLSSKTGTMKKIKTLKKNGGKFRASSVKEK